MADHGDRRIVIRCGHPNRLGAERAEYLLHRNQIGGSDAILDYNPSGAPEQGWRGPLRAGHLTSGHRVGPNETPGARRCNYGPLHSSDINNQALGFQTSSLLDDGGRWPRKDDQLDVARYQLVERSRLIRNGSEFVSIVES
jgi:hypothetical protein